MKPTITYDGRSTVTASVRVVNDSDFDTALSACDSAISTFQRSKPGSDWGSDGVGYDAQRRIGLAIRHRSGVGPRKYAQTMKQLLHAARLQACCS